jgi:hypothetical protein
MLAVAEALVWAVALCCASADMHELGTRFFQQLAA